MQGYIGRDSIIRIGQHCEKLDLPSASNSATGYGIHESTVIVIMPLFS